MFTFGYIMLHFGQSAGPKLKIHGLRSPDFQIVAGLSSMCNLCVDQQQEPVLLCLSGRLMAGPNLHLLLHFFVLSTTQNNLFEC